MRPITPPRSPVDYLALVISTGLLTGYAPIAPGTFGSALAAGLYYGAAKLGLFSPFAITSMLPLLVVCVVVSYVGTWASTRAVGFFGRKDPSQVTVDEVAGQLITYVFLSLTPRLATVPWSFEIWTVAGFFLFRALDIFKPFPARDLEALKDGLGIMGDDIVSGIQGSVLLTLGAHLTLLVLGKN